MSRLKVNLLYSIAYQILNIILPLITAPYIARVLGVSGVGIFSYSYAVLSNFLLFAMLGITNHGSKSIALTSNIEERSKCFWGIYIIQLLMHLIIGISYLVYTYSDLCIDKEISIILAIGLLSSAFDISWFYFGLEEFKVTVTRNFLLKIATTCLIFILVRKNTDLYLYASIIIVGTLASQSYLWIFIRRYIKLIFPSSKQIIENLKPILILFIPIVSFSAYKIFSKILLGALGSIDEVGLFENASKLLNVPLGFISAVGIVMLPRISSLIKEKNNQQIDMLMGISIKMNAIFISCFSFAMISTSLPVVLILFGNEFRGSSPILSILSLSLFFVAWANIIRTQWLIPTGRNKIYVTATIIGAIVSISSNLLLIPMLGGIGAAISSVLAEGTIFLSYLISMKKEKISLKNFTCSIPYIMFGIIMFVIIRLCAEFFNCSLLVSLFISAFVGGGAYVLMSYVFMKHKDPSMYIQIRNVMRNWL